MLALSLYLALNEAFAAAMARLGPYGPAPRLAVAVSGGADSTALALLAQSWAAARGGSVIALIIDHGLRADSGVEAELTKSRLAARGIGALILPLNLPAGAALQERARLARHEALAKAARAAGYVHLLLGHHAGDQSETVAMRASRGVSGLEGMAGWTARNDIVLLRPLLGIRPADLRTFLQTEDMAWVEDPSNADPKFERVRLRQAGADRMTEDAGPRQAREREAASFLARFVTMRPEGFAVIHMDSAPPAALAALLRMAGGAHYPPAQAKVAALAGALRPAALGGVCVARTKRLGGGWLVAREPAYCAAPVPAIAGAVWDSRFRLAAGGEAGETFGPLGPDAAKFRKISDLPALVLRGLPCLRGPGGGVSFPSDAVFIPPAPATCLPFAI